MKTLLTGFALTTALAIGTTALAGPNVGSRPFGSEAQVMRAAKKAPYALTGTSPSQRREQKLRDVGASHGRQIVFERVPASR